MLLVRCSTDRSTLKYLQAPESSLGAAKFLAWDALGTFISAAVAMLCKQHLQPVVTGDATRCLDKAREGQRDHPDKKICLGKHRFCVDIASSVKGEDLMRSLDQLLRSVAEH